MNQHKQSGAVSLFVVIFAALLTVVITVSFIRLVIQDQQRATSNDLSQSAYDSALAGVEDAKRAIVRYQMDCAAGNDCEQARNDLTSSICNYGITGNSSGEEVLIQRDEADTASLALDQAYTCVKINLDTPTYEKTLKPDQSVLVPLVASSSFDRLTISWFEPADSSSLTMNLEEATEGLLLRSGWPTDRPSVLRSQLIQVADAFKLTDFDAAVDDTSNTDTLFLYPVRLGMSTSEFTPSTYRFRDGADKSAKPIRCKLDISAGGYACTARISLPNAIGAEDSAERRAFLRLGGYYNATKVSISLFDGSYDPTDLVNFSGVQPSIDSTGRANDLFRRVEARVNLGDLMFPYPEAAVGVNGSLCKNFSVTESMYFEGDSSCTP